MITFKKAEGFTFKKAQGFISKKAQGFISKKADKLGFTIIELLVVFSLVGVISGLGFVSMVSYSRQQVLVQGSNNLKLDFDQAKFNALSAVKPVACTDNNSLTGYKIVICSNASCVNSGVDYEIVALCGVTEIVTNSRKLDQNLNFNPQTTTCSVITFTALSGAATGTNCDVVIEGYGNQTKIVIDASGNVSI
ncbi:MAG: hypothetical protein COU27_00570 [Candidatus Levybacteria bacterium CG10_big_fil_rev_8_21_14_0_10_36_7]|nr:MAG: hypothetical protein COU27_00570 [Candidatus Levybacteria bacterium CG10_big_fil_rev_8_21_14_0_10_36_7]